MGFSKKIGKTYVFASAVISLIMVLLILVVLIAQSWPAISKLGLSMFTSQWQPTTNKYGILPMLYGTGLVSIFALLIAMPFGLAVATFIAEFLKPSIRVIVKSILELLAGLPSIVYGLIGVTFVSIWVQDWFVLETGRTIFVAGIILSVMILPTIITLIDDALTQIPRDYKESAYGLGLYKFEVIRLLHKMVRPDIIGAYLLAMGRALGETMAVMLVIGSVDKIPKHWFNLLTPGQTITSKLGREMAEASFGSMHFSVLICLGLVLLFVVLLFTFLSQIIFKTSSQLYD